MILFIIFLFFLLILAGLLGYKQILQLEHLTTGRLFNSMVLFLVILTVMIGAQQLGFLPRLIAARVTMGLFIIASGFFIGYGTKLLSLRKKAGKTAYMHRSFWVDVAPNLIAIALLVFGIYRTGVLYWGPFTGIGITSGISLMGFGFFGWTIHIVPEFRLRGILLLDQYIEWEKVVSYSWVSEEGLQIDYLNPKNQISEFHTFIPDEDRLIIERLLENKIDEYREERKKMMLGETED